jgi:hypothetical protein
MEAFGGAAAGHGQRNRLVRGTAVGFPSRAGGQHVRPTASFGVNFLVLPGARPIVS